MKYTIEQLADIIDGDRGKNYPKQNEFLDKGYCLFLNTGNVTAEGFSFETNQFITEEKDRSLNKGKLQRGDIVYTTRGTVGNAAFYSNAVPYENIRINSGMVIFRCDDEVINNSFLYQILKSAHYRHYFKSFCTGTAQPQLPIKNLKNITVNIPARIKQDRIANCLSAYDDLIENNQKQIKLLEEAAQRLYKEWFVDLRFPGYEDVHIVDGVPEGWKQSKVTELLEIKYGKDHKALEDGKIPVYGSGGVMRRVKQILYSGESVLIPRKGSLNNILYVDCDFWTIDTMFYSIPRMKDVAKYSYLYLITRDMYSFNIGAAVPSMTTKILDGMDILLPDETALAKFETAVSPLFEKKKLLEKQNEQLTEARDRLLPKLMSGEIEL